MGGLRLSSSHTLSPALTSQSALIKLGVSNQRPAGVFPDWSTKKSSDASIVFFYRQTQTIDSRGMQSIASQPRHSFPDIVDIIPIDLVLLNH